MKVFPSAKRGFLFGCKTLYEVNCLSPQILIVLSNPMRMSSVFYWTDSQKVKCCKQKKTETKTWKCLPFVIVHVLNLQIQFEIDCVVFYRWFGVFSLSPSRSLVIVHSLLFSKLLWNEFSCATNGYFGHNSNTQ